METGAELHHRIRHDWLVRLRELGQQADDLHSCGGGFAGVHKGRSIMTTQYSRLALAASYGRHLLYEIELFRADSFGSQAEARNWIEQCASTALAAASSALDECYEVMLHPESRDELFEVVQASHRRTLASLAPTSAAHRPVPAYRWRLPAAMYSAGWGALARKWLSQRGNMRGDLVARFEGPDPLFEALRAHGVRRVLHYHPAPANCCEMDIELLLGSRHDWVSLEGHLTVPTLDWIVELEDYGEWNMFGRFTAV